MWKQILKSVLPPRYSGVSALTVSDHISNQQIRTTFILKRRWPPGLYKKGQTTKKLKTKNFVYDLVEDTNIRKKAPLDLILTDYVAGLGNRGDRITMKQRPAYHQLLLPGLAVYASPENIEKFSKENISVTERKFSSPFVQKTINVLSDTNVYVYMNKDVPWTVEPWHIRLSFRRAGIQVSEDAISLPKEPISGPNMELENKYFHVTVTINNTEKVSVKCTIVHWHTNLSERSTPLEKVQELFPSEPIFPEEILKIDSNINSNQTKTI